MEALTWPPFKLVDIVRSKFRLSFFLQDTQLVIERYKSGFVPPEDFPFEEQRGVGADTTDAAPHHHLNHLTAARGTVSGNRIKKRGGLLSIFSSNKVRFDNLFVLEKGLIALL